MKWILILPIMGVCLIGAKPIQVETSRWEQFPAVSVNTKIDSLNIKMIELRTIIEKP